MKSIRKGMRVWFIADLFKSDYRKHITSNWLFSEKTAKTMKFARTNISYVAKSSNKNVKQATLHFKAYVRLFFTTTIVSIEAESPFFPFHFAITLS